MMAMLLLHSDGYVGHGILLHAMGVLNVDVARAHVTHRQLLSALALRNRLHGHAMEVART